MRRCIASLALLATASTAVVLPTHAAARTGRAAAVLTRDAAEPRRQQAEPRGPDKTVRGGAAARGPPGVAWPISVCFLYFMSVALSSSSLPAMVNIFSNADGTAAVHGGGARLYGSLVTIDQLFTFLFVGLWGTLSDAYGRRPFMCLAGAGVSVGWLTVARATSLSVMVAGRALDGITSCMLPLAQVAVVDCSAPDKVSQNLGVLQVRATAAAAAALLPRACSPPVD